MPISQPTDVETESQSAKARHFFEVIGEAGNLHIIALFAYTGEAIFGRSPLIGRHAGAMLRDTMRVPSAVLLSLTCKTFYHALREYMILHMKIYIEHQKALAHRLSSACSYMLHSRAYSLAQEHVYSGADDPLTSDELNLLQPPPFNKYIEARNAEPRLERIDADDGRRVVPPPPHKDYNWAGTELMQNQSIHDCIQWAAHDLLRDQADRQDEPSAEDIPHIEELGALKSSKREAKTKYKAACGLQEEAAVGKGKAIDSFRTFMTETFDTVSESFPPVPEMRVIEDPWEIDPPHTVTQSEWLLSLAALARPNKAQLPWHSAQAAFGSLVQQFQLDAPDALWLDWAAPPPHGEGPNPDQYSARDWLIELNAMCGADLKNAPVGLSIFHDHVLTFIRRYKDAIDYTVQEKRLDEEAAQAGRDLYYVERDYDDGKGKLASLKREWHEDRETERDDELSRMFAVKTSMAYPMAHRVVAPNLSPFVAS